MVPYGKSLFYQLLPFMLNFRRGSTEAQDTEQCCVIVMSPLLSRMQGWNYQRRMESTVELKTCKHCSFV